MQNADGARSTASRAVLPPELRSILAEQPQVPFRLRRIDADPAAALTTTGSDAALLVLGCHHSDEPWSTRLGPVPTALLSRAALPVVLVGCAAR
jgi:nucleotide-binding universal stress UspA family protein